MSIPSSYTDINSPHHLRNAVSRQGSMVEGGSTLSFERVLSASSQPSSRSRALSTSFATSVPPIPEERPPRPSGLPTNTTPRTQPNPDTRPPTSRLNLSRQTSYNSLAPSPSVAKPPPSSPIPSVPSTQLDSSQAPLPSNPHAEPASRLMSRSNMTLGSGVGSGSKVATAQLPASSTPRIRNVPHLPNFRASRAGPSSMHWNRAPVHGKLPTHGFRAHTVSYIEETQKVWLFGGADAAGCYSDIYCIDTESYCWSQPKTTGDVPPPTRAHSAVVAGTWIIIFGGGDAATYLNDLYILDTYTYKWKKYKTKEAPPPRRAHTCIMYDSILYIFGGGTGVRALNDLWGLDISKPEDEWIWIRLQTRLPDGSLGGPRPRGYHTANIVNNSMVVVGGSDGQMCFSDVWILDFQSYVWKSAPLDDIGDPPPRLLGHTATQVGSYIFMIGGSDSARFNHEVRLFNLITLKYESKPVHGRFPASRAYHATTLADSGTRIWLFGGYDGSNVFDDVWILELASQAYLAQVTIFDIGGDDEEGMYYMEEGEEVTSGGYHER